MDTAKLFVVGSIFSVGFGERMKDDEFQNVIKSGF